MTSSDGASRAAGFVSGTLSGLTKLVVGHPFDTIKVRMQVASHLYAGPLDCLRQTVIKEGYRAVYKGASPPALGWAISDALLMGSLNTYRIALAKVEGGLRGGADDRPREAAKLSLLGHGVAGTLAGQTVCLIITPIELLKAKLQMQTHSAVKQFSGPVDCAKQIVQVQGVRGLWHAFPATLLFRAWFGPMFATYEVLMRQFRSANLSAGTSNFLSGGLSSTVFWTGSFAFDAVKNRMMSDSIREPRYPTWMSAARQIHSEGGAKAFYRGFTPCILRAVPTNAAAIAVWEASMRALGSREIH